jgi:hypothetical protein
VGRNSRHAALPNIEAGAARDSESAALAMLSIMGFPASNKAARGGLAFQLLWAPPGRTKHESEWVGGFGVTVSGVDAQEATTPVECGRPL